MRRSTILLAGAALAIFTLGGLGVSIADGGCTKTHQHTAAGSCKDGGGHANPSDDYQIHCGDKGQRGPAVGGVRFYANQTSDGGEVEACSDSGPGNQQGRVVIVGSTDEQGVRGTLDSDPNQPFAPGWISGQASAKSGNDTGLYCSKDEGETGGPVRGDGYSQPWTNPGPDSGADCVPNPPA